MKKINTNTAHHLKNITALDSRAASTTTARPGVIKPVDEIKIRLKHCDQCFFLQPILSATIFKSIFEFRIWIPNKQGFFI